jgi:Domain of unknown function (DUF4114)/RTX calcium-binding nonapeptide repeat (4 copies)/Metallo-peptidase family M12B Reprolysin-like
MSTDTPDPDASVFDTPKGGLYGGFFDPSGLDPNVQAVMMDYRWTTSFEGPTAATRITYSFPQDAEDYTVVPGYPAANNVDTFAPLTAAQMTATRTGFDLVASYTQLTFVEVASGLASDATFRFARFDDGGSVSEFPSNNGSYSKADSRNAADTFLGGNGDAPTNFLGTDDFNTIIHEMGHAFGLKHGHDPSFNGALAPQYNDNEFSVMTYASYFGADTDGATKAIVGSAPQSFMMFDIAALQAYYGANFSKQGTTAVYTWDAYGQEYINGVVAPDTSVTATQKIFSTVWTEGATTTYDLHNFSDNQVDDLRPAHWLTFSYSQLADLNSAAPVGTPQFQAQGNIYNTLLYHGNTDSEITTLVTGNGNDKIIGNDLDDLLNAGAGNDTIMAGSGDDIMIGGPGADSIYFHFGNGSQSSGHDILRDTPADLNGDQVSGFGSGYTSALDVLGVEFGHSSLVISNDLQSATLNLPDATTKLIGTFTGGDFMIDTRGSGDQEHTTFSFVQFMPGLAEGKAVSPSVLNGIANQPFLTGDGSVDFTLTFNQAVSAFANTLGFYEVSADGTMHDVHILFGDTLGATAGQTIDLGVPGNNERIGFFLIQDGFDKYGNLPNDLSFLSPSMQQQANLNSFGTPVLVSASHGALTAAQIFHSFDALNPGGAPQVLSGMPPGTHTLEIGFEDLQNGKGDNDFQDVVVSINASHGYLLS